MYCKGGTQQLAAAQHAPHLAAQHTLPRQPPQAAQYLCLDGRRQLQRPCPGSAYAHCWAGPGRLLARTRQQVYESGDEAGVLQHLVRGRVGQQCQVSCQLQDGLRGGAK